MGQRLAGKTALITAAGQGIGRATAEVFAAHGAAVIATDINPVTLAELAALDGVTARSLDVLDGEKDIGITRFDSRDVVCHPLV